MAQENQEDNSVDPATIPVRRKRGRPRKDDATGSESGKRTRRRKVDFNAHSNDPLVGQVVSGVLNGKFDAGYMLTAQVGDTGTVLRGVVFEPGRSVPISAANDVAPNVKMFQRHEIPIPSAETRSQLPVCTPVRSVVKKDGVVKHRQRNESALPSKGTCTNPITKDLNSEVQTHLSVETKGLPDNTNHIPKELTQDLQSAIGDHVQNLQSTISAEKSKNDHLEEAVGNAHLVAQTLQPSISEPKQAQAAEILDADTVQNLQSTVSAERSKTALQALLQETAGNTNLVAQTLQPATSEPKQAQATETFYAKLVGDLQSIFSTESSKIVHLQEAVGNTNPVTQILQPSTFEPKQAHAAETLDSNPVITNEPSDDFDKALPVTDQASEHEIKEMVDDDGNVSGVQHDKILLGNEATKGTADSSKQESQVYVKALLGAESKSGDACSEPKSQPSELIPQVLASLAIPEQLQCNKTSSSGGSNQVASIDAIEATMGGTTQAADADSGSYKA